MAIYLPTKAAVKNETENTSSTELHTGDLDIIIAKIQQLKAQTQSDSRDAQIQTLSLQRNAILENNKNAWNMVS